jgi:hypothetical protein
LGLAGSVLGLTFASYSTFDYAQHLDRRLHDVHCSLIPGITSGASGENSCRAAMYSVYSALFRGSFWGGIPVAIFAVGAFAFFVGFSIYLLLGRRDAPRRAFAFYALAGATPFLVSLVMFVIAVTKLGSLCKTCVGIYLSSALLATGAWLAWRAARGPGESRPEGTLVTSAAWLVLLGASALLPSLVYAASVPDQTPYLSSCGKIDKTTESHGALLKLRTATPVRPALLFEDPLCPTCKAFHQRIVDEGAFERLDAQLVLFPLDSECNWMLTTALHPGACVLSRAVICGGERAREVLEWAYDHQDDLAALAKTSPASLREQIAKRWGPTISGCVDTAATKLRLNQALHFAADNAVPVSTPQLYLGAQRICDEDTDLGLRYTLVRLAPEVLP